MRPSRGSTLGLGEDSKVSPVGPRPEPVLVLVLECDRPRSGSVRYRLSELTGISIGRGPERSAKLTGTELTIRVPDKWMSTRHARIEPTFGRWVLADTESKNGCLVDGHTTKRAMLTDGSVIEIGHTLFLFFDEFLIEGDAPTVLERTPTDGPPGTITLVPSWQAELTKLTQVASSEIPILLEGESGTGKEVVARAVHGQSGRNGPFVRVHCGVLPDDLVESELYGYRKAGIADSVTERTGLLRSANGGTLFLDEVGELPPSSQVALLRVLQEREVMPLGGTRTVAIDLRVVASTHHDLDAMVADGRFRPDLLAGLAGFRVTLPTLDERRADLGLLIGAQHLKSFPQNHPGIDIDAARLLARYPWPHNIRELAQALATALVLAGGKEIGPKDLPESVRTGRPPGSRRPVILSEADQQLRDELAASLREHQGNVSAVARALDKDRKQIQRWIKRFGLEPTSYR